jgi:hypothetical protein
MPTLTDDQLRLLIQDEAWYVATRQRRCASDLAQLGIAQRKFADSLAAIRRAAASLCNQEALLTAGDETTASRHSHIAACAELLKETLTRHWAAFRIGPASYLLPRPDAVTRCDETVQAAWRHMYLWIVKEFPHQIEGCYAVLDRLIERNSH